MLRLSGIQVQVFFATAMIAMVGPSMPVSAGIAVTFDQIARSGDPVPGREALNVVFNGRAFQQFGFTDGVLSRPSMNASGEVVFRGESSHPLNFNFNSAIGLYVKSPASSLSVLVDTTVDVSGNPTFPVPGRPTGTRFSNFRPPLINNAGDVVFYATIGGPEGGGSGFYSTTTAGGPIVKIVDSFDPVPGFPGITFDGFAFGGTFRRFILISLNDVGQIVFMGSFRAPDDIFVDDGIYGTTVSGGTLTRLADATASIAPVDQPPGITIHGLQQDRQPALNNAGIVVFGAGIGPTPFTSKRALFAVPVDGSSGIITLAQRFQPVLLSDGFNHGIFTLYSGHDINDSGQFVFQHFFGSGFGGSNALITGNINDPGIPLTAVVDNAGGFPAPNRPGASITGTRISALTESGQMGIDALDSTPNGKGIYALDLNGGPLGFIAHNGTPLPGRPSVAFIDFSPFDNPNDGESVVINELGNMAFVGIGINETGTGTTFGLYFYDSCTKTVDRVVDDLTSSPAPPAGLGGVFAAQGCGGSPCQRFIKTWDGFDTRAGQYRVINDNNDIAFVAAFSTFDVGVYVAHVQTGGGGDLRIVCPSDVALECGPAPDTSVSVTGEPAVCSDNPVTLSSTDTIVVDCGAAQTLTRTWTAVDNVTQASVSCDQIITLVDTTPPIIAGVPPDANVDCNALPPPATPTVTDDCDPIPQLVLDEFQTAASCGGDIILTRTWTAIDACGNQSVACQILTMGDTNAPILTVPPDVTIACGADSTPATTGTAGATADCLGTATVTHSDSVTPGLCGGQTIITRTWTATDTCAHTASADQTITEEDTTPPVITLPANVTLECDADTSPAATGTATATDACGGAVTVNHEDVSTTADFCGAGGQIVRTWMAVDECGNVVTADQTITLVDSTAPVVTGPANVTIECDVDPSPVNTGMATASDGCDAAPMVSYSDTVAGACPTIITRTWTATDACGQTSTTIQTITQQDSTPPDIACPGNISTSGGFGGTTVSFTSSASDTCDLNPVVTATATSGAIFPTGVTTVTASAADACGNSSANCTFDVLVSCFGVNRAKIGTKQARCEGIALIEFTSLAADGSTLFSLFVSDDSADGNGNSNGSGIYKLPASIIVDDGVNGSQTVDTSCATPIAIGDVFGPYAVSDLVQVFDDLDDDHGNEVEIRGSFDPAVPFDPPTSDIGFTIDDGAGHTASYTIPAGSFEMDGNPEKGKFKFEGNLGVMEVKAKFEKCKFKLKIKNATNTGQLVGTTMTIGLTVGPNVAADSLLMQDKHNHLKFKRQPKLNCCPECEGVASMQVTSDQGVLVFVPAPGETKLSSNTVVDDGVNGAVTIHTSCSQPLDVGDKFGPYTISELIKSYEQE